ncbi:MAG: hypothetical protein GX613_06275 [Chloroflexi bacterium]|nr:hypothetical protein [Chloroflexota bacterium]
MTRGLYRLAILSSPCPIAAPRGLAAWLLCGLGLPLLQLHCTWLALR